VAPLNTSPSAPSGDCRRAPFLRPREPGGVAVVSVHLRGLHRRSPLRSSASSLPSLGRNATSQTHGHLVTEKRLSCRHPGGSCRTRPAQ
jgi:hypothetical protein